MNEQERAEEHLQIIRRLMERATIYRAISAPTALVAGLLSLLASALYLALERSQGNGVDEWQSSGTLFLRLWVSVLILTSLANAIFITLGARHRGERIFSSSMKAALRALAPALLAGAAFTLPFALAPLDPRQELWLATLWTALYGVGLLATGHFSPSSLVLLGWAFLLSGILEVILQCAASMDLYTLLGGHIGLACMTFTFGLYHLVYAVCAWPRRGAPLEA